MARMGTALAHNLHPYPLDSIIHRNILIITLNNTTHTTKVPMGTCTRACSSQVRNHHHQEEVRADSHRLTSKVAVVRTAVDREVSPGHQPREVHLTTQSTACSCSVKRITSCQSVRKRCEVDHHHHHRHRVERSAIRRRLERRLRRRKRQREASARRRQRRQHPQCLVTRPSLLSEEARRPKSKRRMPLPRESLLIEK